MAAINSAVIPIGLTIVLINAKDSGTATILVAINTVVIAAAKDASATVPSIDFFQNSSKSSKL